MAKILLGVTGGIAAYKSPDLVRRLREAGHQVKAVLTQGGQAFITPLSLQAVSANIVHMDLLDPTAEAAMGHIELARWADRILIAPASANFMARLAHGFADDLLSTICLATEAPITIVPAMNKIMWQNQATQSNLKILMQRGVTILGPASGSQACGEIGVGRMLDPIEIVAELQKFIGMPLLKGKKVLVSAGPTYESIDPVRYLTNKSSGKMGYALAEAAVNAGAIVTLVSGPVHLNMPAGVKLIRVKTAEDMLQAVMQHIEIQDIFISTAAVADYRIKEVATKKIKKSAETMQLELVRNPDILAQVAALKKRPFVVGFAAETDDIINNAMNKLQNKKLDMVIVNDVSQEGIGFESDDNAVTLLMAGEAIEFDRASKRELANKLIETIAKQYSVASL